MQLVGKDSLSEDQKAILRVSFLLTKAVFRLLKSSRTSSCNRTHSLSSILTAQCTRPWAWWRQSSSSTRTASASSNQAPSQKRRFQWALSNRPLELTWFTSWPKWSSSPLTSPSKSSESTSTNSTKTLIPSSVIFSTCDYITFINLLFAKIFKLNQNKTSKGLTQYTNT